MEPSKDRGCRRNAFPIRVALALALLILATAPALLAQSDWIGPEALAQMKAIADDKRARTPAQKKIDSNLIYASRQTRGQPAATGVPMLQTFIDVGPAGDTVVDITGVVTPSLIARLQELGGSVVDSQPSYRSLRAIVPLASLEPLAEHPGVIFIQPKQEAMLMGAPVPTRAAGAAAPFNRVSRLSVKSIRPDFSVRAENVRRQLGAALKTLGAKSGGASPSVPAKTNTSEGRVTHRADLAASTFGATGAGIKVGVLSDGVNSLASLQASGDLPAVTVLAGQAGSGDEGSAMLEIVFDMAPSAQLFFATANTSITSFAQNIRDLRTAGCDVIIDDVGYFVESPFQKGQAGSVVSTSNGGVVTQAVVDVAAGGALYFSSSANSGSKDKGTSGTWEGDFVDGGLAGGILAGAGHLHDFDPGAGTTTFDTITAAGGFTFLFWSDPLGGSSNDYDLYILNSAGTKVLGASTNTQNGTQDPIEGLTGSPLNDRVVIALFSGSARFLHLDTNRGKLTFNTAGNSHGHNAPPGPGAFGVAATPAAAACCGGGANPVGPFPNPFNSANTVELFSSDGLRQYFFNADSSAITPGNFLAGGGEVVQQPLVSAADGVSCAAPGFNPFFGTSAAAPHAGAIAALVKSVNPSLTAAQIKTILTSTAIDIEAAGTDRDSGFGILDAFSAVQAGVPGGTPTPTRTSTPTNTPSNTPTKTNTPTNTPTKTPANTPTNTPTNAFTFTNTPTKTVTTSPTFTPTNTPTSTKTPTNTPTNTAVVSTNTPTVTPTPTNSTPTASKTPTPTNTPT
ncbi:MAG TPA: S8 family serine peptidase, partial [Thermoanaerobaculia bacterium]|nr:S8 family serine peptidase [Thermoanaerobaculia bacterium]